MRTIKYTFRTPLHGSIDCSDVLPDQDSIKLSPRDMCTLYSDHKELDEFLRNHKENLTSCVDEQLHHVVLRAEFGDVAMLNGELYLLTYIWTYSVLSDERIEYILGWISGQLSDGWGEGLEQRSWKQERVIRPYVYFDEDSLTFEQDEEEWFVRYYVHPWTYEDYSIDLHEVDAEDVEDPEMVASMSVMSYRRVVYKFTTASDLIVFLQYNDAQELATWLEGHLLDHPADIYYIAVTPQEGGGIVIGSKFALSAHDECFVFGIYSTISPLAVTCTHYNLSTEEALVKLLA